MVQEDQLAGADPDDRRNWIQKRQWWIAPSSVLACQVLACSEHQEGRLPACKDVDPGVVYWTGKFSIYY